MKSKILLFLVAIPFHLYCQTNQPEVLATLGGSQKNSELSMDWTLGEVFINEFLIDDLMLSQGFHQSFSSIPSSFKNHQSNFEINVFPNPVDDKLTIHIQDSYTNINWRLEVYNILGVRLIDESLKGDKNEINFSSLPAGSYLARISHNNFYKIFHIVKNDFSHEKN